MNSTVSDRIRLHPGPLATLAALATMAALAWVTAPTPAAAAGFVFHANAFLGPQRTPSVKLSAEIPYSSLVFLREDGAFKARYSIAVTIRDRKRDNEVVRTGVFKGDAVADDYNETHSNSKRSRPSKVFPLPPGEYSIDAVLMVKNTHIRYQRTTSIVVPDFLASGMGFGTPEIFFLPFGQGQRVVQWDSFDERDEMKRADMGMIGLNVLDAQPAVRFELFLNDDVAVPLICGVFYEVRNAEDKRVLYGRSRARLVGEKDIFVLTFDAENWEPGAYTVNLRATANGGKIDARAKMTLDLDVTHAMLDEYFEDTLAILSLIATQGQLEGLTNATPEMRADEWGEFWRVRDPDPSTPENEALEQLLNRVREATTKYSQYGKAWHSDRGSVYIRYGKPDKIERTNEVSNRGEYEVWTYVGQGRTFVFYAQYAGGQYRLVEGEMF